MNDSIDADTADHSTWFSDMCALRCAVISLQTLESSIKTHGNDLKKFQRMLCIQSSDIVKSAAFWIARHGPMELLMPALKFIVIAVSGNSETSNEVSEIILKVPPAVKNKTIPLTFEPPQLRFGWKLMQKDNRVFIGLPNILSELYIFEDKLWYADNSAEDILAIREVPDLALAALDEIFASDTRLGGIIFQHILAPPPPSMSDGDEVIVQSPQPLGLILLNTAISNAVRLVDQQSPFPGSISGGSPTVEAKHAARCCNILTLILLHGGILARELGAAVTTARTCLSQLNHNHRGAPSQSQPLFPFLLSIVGRLSRSCGSGAMGTDGVLLISSLLGLLATAVTGCEATTRQV